MGIKLKSKALLSKWIWWFYNEKTTLWRRVVAIKYNSTHFGNKPSSHSLNYSKDPWKYIMRQQDLIFKNLAMISSHYYSILVWYLGW